VRRKTQPVTQHYTTEHNTILVTFNFVCNVVMEYLAQVLADFSGNLCVFTTHVCNMENINEM
jgi:hypothetical protein